MRSKSSVSQGGRNEGEEEGDEWWAVVFSGVSLYNSKTG